MNKINQSLEQVPLYSRLKLLHESAGLNKIDLKNTVFSVEQCREIQKNLMGYVKLKPMIQESQIRWIGGVDLAYWKEGEMEKGVCSVVVMTYPDCKVVEKQYSMGIVSFPYLAGCLSFRELPFVLEAVEKLHQKPDLYFFDGNGYLHPYHMGIATHASFYLHAPTIGIAKSYYKIKGHDFVMPGEDAWEYSDILIGQEVYGRAVRTHEKVRPIFLSPGNYIDLDTSMKLVQKVTSKESHIPIPTRLADLDTHEKRKLQQNLSAMQ